MRVVLPVLAMVACAVEPAEVEANEAAAARSAVAVGGDGGLSPVEAVPVEGGAVQDCCTADASAAGIDFMQGIIDDRGNNANHLGCSITGQIMTCCVDPGVAIHHADPIPAGSSCFVGP